MIYSFWLIQACDVYENSLANNIYDKEEYKEALSLLRYDGFKDMLNTIFYKFLSLEHFLQWYSRPPITRTLAKLEPRANSNQNRFPMDFLHTFTVILPSVTRTLDNSNSR